MRVAGYVRVSTTEQGESGAGLNAQRRAIEAEASRRGWEEVRIFEDVASGRRVNGRHGLDAAIDAVESGTCEALVVAKLDRLSRSLSDFASLMERARKRGWSIVALDVGIDTTTPNGEMMAGMLAVLAQWERRIIGQRTKDALASKRAQGVRLGRPPTPIPARVRGRIMGLHIRGRSLREIAERLNRAGVASPTGGLWYASSVRREILR